MEKLSSKNLNLLFSDGIGRFYCVGAKDSLDKKPIVFINGQMDHRLQAMETFTNATKSSCYQYSWYYQYDQEVHTPYIWVYDYPIYQGNKEKYDSYLFTSSLLNAIANCGLENVDIMGQSVGGIMGMRASTSSSVDRVVAVHPPILSSPLANKELIRSLYLDWKRKILALGLDLLVDDQFGFQKENASGYSVLEREVDLHKIKVVGSSIYGMSHLSGIERYFSDFVYYLTGKENDGVICWDKKELEERGFAVVEDEQPVSHLAMSNNFGYTNGLYEKFLIKK